MVSKEIKLLRYHYWNRLKIC